MRNGPSWRWRVTRPGASPIRRLAETLARISAIDEAEVDRLRDRVEARLRQTSFSLESAMDEARGAEGPTAASDRRPVRRVVPVRSAGLGQRGAVLAEAKARDEATLFVQILLDARRVANVHVLITMRSDFIGDCSYFGGLPEAVSAAQYLVPGLTRCSSRRLSAARRGGRRKHRARAGRETAERLQRGARSASGASALPDADVGSVGRGSVDGVI